MWLLLAFTAGLLLTIQDLFSRKILKSGQDAWAFSFYFSLTGMLVSLPFFIAQPQLSSSLLDWSWVVIMGGLIVLHNFLNFRATNYLEASVKGSVLKLRLVWVILFATVFLGESITVWKILGTIATIAAGLVIQQQFKKPSSQIGLALAVGSTVVYGIVNIIVKDLLASFNSGTLTFFIFAIPTALNYLLMPNRNQRIMQLLKDNGPVIWLACSFGGFANIAMNHALGLNQVSRVIVVIEAFLIILLIGEHFILKERDHLWKKVMAVVLALCGALLLQLGA